MYKKVSIALALSCAMYFAQAQTEVKRIEKDVRFLSSDEMKGRFPGSEEEKKAAKYIIKQFKSLKLIPMGNDGYLQEFPFKSSKNPHAKEGEYDVYGTGRNVIAMLDNGARNTIVIGAHYDHLGLGLAGHSLDANPENKIHNGADDNASGTAGVLELARYFANNNVVENHNILFICFSAEEEGLIGSKFFTNQPSIDLNKVSFMVNMDMIGRLNDSTKKIIISGVGTSPSIPAALAQVQDEHITYKADSNGMGPSDHASFYLKSIPALHFYTGGHSDYHKPSDDADKVNYAGEKMVLDYIVKVINILDKESKIPFTPTKSSTSSSSSASFKVTLGVIPDYAFDGKGLRIDGASEGKPAYKAGMKAGDVILKMDSIAIGDIQDYMKALSKFEKGQTISITILRDAKEMQLMITF
jgi:Zn-dependent M28 family amino/carboxypeptidase